MKDGKGKEQIKERKEIQRRSQRLYIVKLESVLSCGLPLLNN